MNIPEDTQEARHRMVNRINGLSDSDLKIALKKRALYQPEAVDLLILEAKSRGIIHNDEDLQSPEFNAPATGFTLFPCPDSAYMRDKIVRSLMRSVMIAAIIPVYFGITKFEVNKYIEGSALISLGVIWVAMAWFVMERRVRKLIVPMGALALLSILYAGRIMMAYQHLSWTDIFIPVVLYLFTFYALYYTWSLLKGEDFHR